MQGKRGEAGPQGKPGVQGQAGPRGEAGPSGQLPSIEQVMPWLHLIFDAWEEHRQARERDAREAAEHEAAEHQAMAALNAIDPEEFHDEEIDDEDRHGKKKKKKHKHKHKHKDKHSSTRSERLDASLSSTIASRLIASARHSGESGTSAQHQIPDDSRRRCRRSR